MLTIEADNRLTIELLILIVSLFFYCIVMLTSWNCCFKVLI